MEVRTAMTRNGGSLADPGSVSLLFNRKGVVIVPEDAGGARGRARTTSSRRPSTPAPRRSTTSASPSRWSPRRPTWSPCARALQDAGIDYDSAEASFVAEHGQVELDEDGAGKVFRLVDALEDLDDVQNVFANFDVPDEVLAVARRLSRGACRTPSAASRRRLACRAEQVFGRGDSDGRAACACWGSTPG